MQLTQELTFHSGNMSSTMRQLRAFRPPKWVTVLLMAAAFVSGWFGGWMRGSGEQSESKTFFDGAISSIAAKDRAEGKPFLTDRFYWRAVDRMVEQHMQFRNATALEKFKRLASPYDWFTRGFSDSSFRHREHEMVIRFAEQRLALIVAPTEQTKRTLSELNRGYLLDHEEASYADIAAHYSMLLGRNVRSEVFVTDIQMQEHISRLPRDK